MDLIADLMWITGAAVSLGFIVYGGFLLSFVPRLPEPAPAPRLRHAS